MNNDERYVFAAHWINGFKVAVNFSSGGALIDRLFQMSNVDWDEFVESHETAMKILDGHFTNTIHKDNMICFVNAVKRQAGVSWGGEI